MARPRNTEERREEIARGLLEVMAQRGYERASVAGIARAAGLSPGLVHYHFQSKQQILLHLIAGLGEDLERRLDEQVQAAGNDPGARLRAFVEAQLSLRDADPRRVACWVGAAAESIRQPDVAAAFGAALRRPHELLVELLRAALVARGRSPRRARALAAAVQAATQGYFLLAVAAPEVTPEGSAARTLTELLGDLA
ncbi:MAG: TetR/AcrR family transcriptional regulator [Planctomycetota bacterium]